MLEASVKGRERAYLLGVQLPGTTAAQLADEMRELRELALTAGAQVVGEEIQRRDAVDPGTLMGKGKVKDLENLHYELELDLLIANEELTPRQQRNLEKALGIKVVDRTELILDIFAQHARTREGRIQVESAQLHHLLPRLVGGRDLSRLGGGIGTRGPGEQKLEVDRRRIRRRISDLARELREIRQHRTLQREKRDRSTLPVIAIAGYTNSGKSTLLNKLSDGGILAEDKLFATLDPTTRRVTLPGGHGALLTDTVGFIQKLPTDLVAAFRSTLEEVVFADAIVHVVDLSDERFLKRMEAVDRVLMELGAGEKPTIAAFNKVDLLDGDELTRRLAQARAKVPGTPISALTKKGVDVLLRRVDDRISTRNRRLRLLVPYTRSDLVADFHKVADVQKIEYLEDGVLLEGKVTPRDHSRFAAFALGPRSRRAAGRGAASADHS